MNNKEIWKDIPEYIGLYQVSNLGRVKSIKNCRNRILKNHRRVDGYYSVNLSKNNKVNCIRVHRLVAEAFLPNPNNYPIVNHKDERPSNNCVDNLEWCTPKYNINYGTCREKMSKTRTGNKRIVQCSEDGKVIKIWTIEELIKNRTYDKKSVIRCCKNKYKGFCWKYK